MKFAILNSVFLLTLISCSLDIPDEPESLVPEDQNPVGLKKYESKGYYLDGQFDNQDLIIQDTFYTNVGSTLGASTSGEKPDSVILSFGIEFRAIDSSGAPLRFFKIEFKKSEAMSVVDAKHNYLDLNKIDDVITKGPWIFCSREGQLKDKGVSVSYADRLDNFAPWFTESYYQKMFDYSTFKFNVDSVFNDYENKLMVVEGSFVCSLYSFASPGTKKPESEVQGAYYLL